MTTTATLESVPYPGAPQIVVSALPKVGDILHMGSWGRVEVMVLQDRWDSKYVYLKQLDMDRWAPLIQGYLEVRP